MDQEIIQKAVARSPLFSKLDLDADYIKVKSCKKGQIISDRQKDQDILGMVIDGEVDVYSVALDGKEIMLSTLKSGCCFGIINLFADEDMPTVLKCRSNTKLLTIPKNKLLELMKEDRELIYRYAWLCNEKMQFLLRRIEFLTMQSGKNKLIQYLLTKSDCEDYIPTEGSREQLASLLGISRASLFRELSDLQEKKLIAQETGGIRILQKEALESILYDW